MNMTNRNTISLFMKKSNAKRLIKVNSLFCNDLFSHCLIRFYSMHFEHLFQWHSDLEQVSFYHLIDFLLKTDLF